MVSGFAGGVKATTSDFVALWAKIDLLSLQAGGAVAAGRRVCWEVREMNRLEKPHALCSCCSPKLMIASSSVKAKRTALVTCDTKMDGRGRAEGRLAR